MSLEAFPLSLAEANAVVVRLHRHHNPVRFHLFSVGAREKGKDLCGVAIVMRPVNQAMSFQGLMCEVSRLATDGTHNACSFLLSRCARIAFEMGYLGIQTYTIPTEGGASLRAAGWVLSGESSGRAWTTQARKRSDSHPAGRKSRWWRLRGDFAADIGFVQP